MSATELEEVQALLERVLPDPSGFAQRLLLQAMTQFGESAARRGSVRLHRERLLHGGHRTRTSPRATSSLPLSRRTPTDEGLADTNVLLAAALGACECWGLRADCDLCQGQGSAGWTEPVPELFDEFVGPAIARLPDVSA